KDNAWQPVALSYYVMEEITDGVQAYWAPVFSKGNVHLGPRPDGLLPEPLGIFEQSALENALLKQIANPTAPWKGPGALGDLPPSLVAAASRALPTGCGFNWGGGLVRWENTNINLQHNATNAPSDISTRLTNAHDALLSNYEGLGLNYVGAASPTYTPDCSGGNPPAQGNNLISYLSGLPGGTQNIIVVFDDPCNRITDLNNCAGAYALSGFYWTVASHQYKGDTWKNAQYGYVVINNGVYSNCLDAGEYELMLQHEITHAHCMQHLNDINYPNQNMNSPGCCNPIGSKDEECMDYVYDLLAPLPVQLVVFEAVKANNRVKIEWTTASEFQNRHFDIERSADGAQFYPIGQMPSAADLGGKTYTFWDQAPLSGHNYYRLRQVDLDGTVHLLGIRQVTFDGQTTLQISPNPATKDQLIVSNVLEQGVLELLDASGRVMLQYHLDEDDLGKRGAVLDIQSLPKGFYTVRWYDSTRQMAAKMVRE
ncbi:MAG: T9SS type A sorting domain-containing protein, partial [Saprospiraceae bacterium]